MATRTLRAEASNIIGKVVDACSYALKFCMTIMHIPCKPLVQASHISHKFSLLIDSSKLGESILLR